MQVPDSLTKHEPALQPDTGSAASRFIIEKAHIAAYGHFRDVDSLSFSPGVNLIFGHNEAGKSTLFSFFHSMLFGIYPTSPARHPYYPRESRHLHGEMWYRRGTHRARVERKLMTAVSGRLDVDGKERNLGQSTLPEADFLNMNVYASVFALTLEDLVAPARSKAWGDIQDGLLGGMSMDFLRSGREVAGELEDEAARLWRPDARGKPLAKALEKDLAALRSQIRDAKKRNEDIRGLVDEIERRSLQHKEVQEREAEVNRRLAKLRRLLPASIALKRLRELQMQASDVGRYAPVPADPMEAVGRLARDVEELDDEIRKRSNLVEQCTRIRDEVTDADRSLVERSAAIHEWGRISGQVDSWQKRLAELEQDIDTANTRRDTDAARIFSDGWSDELAPLLAGVSIAELRAAVEAYSRARQDADEARRAAADAQRQMQPKETTPWLVAAAACVVITATLGILGQLLLGVLVLLGAIFFAVMFELARRHNKRQEQDGGDDRVAKRDQDAEARRRDVEKIIGHLPIPRARLEAPDAQLASDIEAMQRLAEDAARHEKPLHDLQKRLGMAESELKEFASELGVGFTGFESTIKALLDNLLEAEDRVRKAKDAESRQSEIAVELVALREKHERLTQERAELVATLEELGDSAAEGAAVLAERRNAARLAERDQKELRQQYGSIEDIEAEVKQAMEIDPALFADGTEAQLESERDQLSTIREAEAVALAECQKDLEELEKQPLLHELESEEALLQEKLDAHKHERDRLAVLARVIRIADERFRQKHQPDVIRRASSYFAQLTGGRYDGLMLEDEELFLVPSADAATRKLDDEHNWTSRGTRDQMFLAIRLALIDHLDAHHTRLPVFLDEVFVNWDAPRRRMGLQILQSMARRRQIFLFTCHEWFRDEVEQLLHPQIITL